VKNTARMTVPSTAVAAMVGSHEIFMSI
jgi:hypothetical protein